MIRKCALCKKEVNLNTEMHLKLIYQWPNIPKFKEKNLLSIIMYEVLCSGCGDNIAAAISREGKLSFIGE